MQVKKQEKDEKSQGKYQDQYQEGYEDSRQESGNATGPQVQESLSALMDGEADDLELRRILRAMANDPSSRADLSGRWQRYHAVQASLRHEHAGQMSSLDLLSGIHARLETEGLSLEAPHPGRFGKATRFGRVFGKLGQGAIAASVAVLVLYGASQVDMNLAPQGFDTAGTDQLDQISRLSADAGTANLMPELAGEYNPSSLMRTVSMGAAERDRIQRAVQRFSGAAPAVAFGEVYTFPVQNEDAPDQE